jgi:prepilin-type N-terminal cleavage/methylation domain-containing protein
MSKINKAGFTIIELMIATVVFAVIMLIISTALIQIGRLYDKGMTASRTQTVARNIMNDIAQSIQFDKGSIRGTNESLPDDIEVTTATNLSRSICIVDRHYSYFIGQQVSNTSHGLVALNGSGCGGDPAQNLTAATLAAGSEELLGDRMRLTRLAVEPVSSDSPNTYMVTIGVMYGDTDLICSPSLLDNCTNELVLSVEELAEADDLRCKNIRSGSQFCSLSELSTVVERRISQ